MLWAITSYFNPAGYRSRLRNYRIFRANLAVPLIAVELSAAGQFELRGDDADIVVQIAGGDVLWQKERLLNVALAYLPADCAQVAWIDCDLVFANPDWPLRAVQALEQFPVIQLFGHLHDLGSGALPPVREPLAADSQVESVVRKIRSGTEGPGELVMRDGALARQNGLGFAWAARRELVEKHGLYDACILGGGDRAYICAALGCFELCTSPLRMGSRRVEHYLAWARPFYEAVRGRVDFIDGRLFHLWHGELVNRRYKERHDSFIEYYFDPFTDIVQVPSGCWRWNGAKAEMHQYVRRYFESRKEDG